MLEIYKKIQKNLETRHVNTEHDYEQKRLNLINNIPQFKDIEREIFLTGIKMSKALISGNEDISSFTKTIAQLENKKTELLLNNGYSVDYLEKKYYCSKCQDTGSVLVNNLPSNELCSCVKQLMVKYTFEMLNINENNNISFEAFDLALYSDKPNQKEYRTPVSPRDAATKIKKLLEEYPINMDNNKNIMLFGRTGTGKTYLCKSLARKAIENGINVVYLSAPELLDIVINDKFNGDFHKIKLINNCELLIIDDLGTEPKTDARMSSLLNILNNRLERKQGTFKTIISTNLAPQEIYDVYQERISSRILGHFDIYMLFGEDIRIKKCMV